MIKISVNNKLFDIEDTVKLIDLIQTNNPENKPVAVAINGEFLPRVKHEAYILNAGDKIDIVSPVGGG